MDRVAAEPIAIATAGRTARVLVVALALAALAGLWSAAAGAGPAHQDPRTVANPRVGQSGQQAKQVSAGGGHTCVVKMNGKVRCSGRDDLGQASPPRAPSFRSVSAGRVHTYGVRMNRKVRCWGADGDGQASAPQGPNFRSVSAGNVHTCGVRMNRKVRCWGRNDYGQTDVPPGLS